MEKFFDVLRMSIHNTLKSVSEETVNNIIHVIQYVGFNSLQDLQLVQERDLIYILKPIPRRKLIKAWNEPGVIEKLNREYWRMKNKDASRQIDEFLSETKNSFQFTSNPVKMESITELLKRNISRILDSVSEETLDNIIHTLNDAGLQFLLDLQFVREDDLPQVLPHFQRKKLLKAWSQQGIPFSSSSSTVVHEQKPFSYDQSIVGHSTYENSSAMSSLSPTNANSSISDLSMLGQRQASVKSDHTDTSQYLSNQFSPYMNQTFGPPLSEHPPGISSLTDQCPLAPGPSTRAFSLSSIGGESIPPVNLYKLMFKNTKWKRKLCILLLRVYAQYKTELSCPSVEEKQIVWRKIAEEFHLLSGCSRCGSRKCVFFSGSECMDQIEILRLHYHANKHENVLSGKMVKFFNTLRRAFESTEDSVTSTELSSRASSSGFKWIWKKRLALLRAYSIYKTELSSSNINEESVWKKIAVKVGNNHPQCDAKLCRNQICDMKSEYESMKHNKPYKFGHLQPVFLDEAENAFENSENPVVFSLQSNLEKWTMSNFDRVKLLQVFTKYKAELLLQNFDVEKQIVWGKVAREVSKKCSSFYGKRRCCYEVNRYKDLYEIYKRKDLKKIGTPYYFHEAGKAFESTECTGQHQEVNSLEDAIVKQERRGWYEHINM